MTVELRARSAADALRDATRQDVDVRAGLAQMRRRNTRRIGVYVAVATAAAVILGLAVLTWTTWHPRASAPITNQPTVVRTSFPLAVPFVAVRPDGWTQIVKRDVLVVLNSPNGPFLAVFIDATPLPTAGSPAPTTLTARSFAGWIAARQELVPTTVVQTKLAGLPAWQVDVKLRAGVPATATCDGVTDKCLPLFRVAGITDPLGVVPGSAGRVYVVQLSNGRVLFVAAGGSTRNRLPEVLAAVQPIIDSLSFGATG